MDINCDLGESFGVYQIGMDAYVMPYITSANVACGYHAGDPLVMEQTVRHCKAAGVGVGAHPGYPDLLGFGRRNMQVDPKELRAYVLCQVGALQAVCTAHGVPLTHVKPHGAMYNMAATDPKLAAAIAEAVFALDPKLPLLGLAGSAMLRAAEAVGLPVAREVFADRAYEDDGTLVPRNQRGAVIVDEQKAIARVMRMVQTGLVTTIHGKDIALQADSVCVHGDSPLALAFAKNIHAAFQKENIPLVPFAKNLK